MTEFARRHQRAAVQAQTVTAAQPEKAGTTTTPILTHPLLQASHASPLYEQWFLLLVDCWQVCRFGNMLMFELVVHFQLIRDIHDQGILKTRSVYVRSIF